MKFTYEDLLSGDEIFASGIGHFRSPLLKELKPTSGVGIWVYSFYLNILSWDRDDFLRYVQISNPKQFDILCKNECLSIFDLMTVLPAFRAILSEALAFFISEKIVWDEQSHRFVTTGDNDKPAGVINRENFDDVRDMCLQVNYISIGDSAAPRKHSTDKAKKLWEKAQAYLKQESKKSSENKHLRMGNIVSKLCAAHAGYTLLNVYDLTVFQLYDQFFQVGYLRAMDLSEAAFANHGGEKFDFQEWLKPITKI